MTCCALHNWLLKIDWADTQWNDGVESAWEWKIGEDEYKGGDDKENSNSNDDDLTINTNTAVAAGANRTANDVPNAV